MSDHYECMEAMEVCQDELKLALRQRDELAEVLKPFADIKADDGDDFSSWYDNVIIRCEVTAGEIKAARAALSRLGKDEV